MPTLFPEKESSIAKRQKRGTTWECEKTEDWWNEGKREEMKCVKTLVNK